MVLAQKIDFPIAQMLDSGIEFIGIINEHGRMDDFVCRNDFPVCSDMREMFWMGIRLQNAMHTDFDEFLGPTNYTITRRGNQKFVSIPISSKVIFAVLDKDKNHSNFVSKITSLAKRAKLVQRIERRENQ